MPLDTMCGILTLHTRTWESQISPFIPISIHFYYFKGNFPHPSSHFCSNFNKVFLLRIPLHAVSIFRYVTTYREAFSIEFPKLPLYICSSLKVDSDFERCVFSSVCKNMKEEVQIMLYVKRILK